MQDVGGDGAFAKLNVREIRYVDGIAQGLDGTAAAIRAGYKPESAADRAREKRLDTNVQTAILNALRSQGFDEELVATKLIELHNSDSFAVTRAGDVVRLGPDGATRSKAMDMTLKVLGAYPNTKIDVNATIGGTLVIQAADVLAPDPFAGAIDVTPEPVEPSEDSNQTDFLIG